MALFCSARSDCSEGLYCSHLCRVSPGGYTELPRAGDGGSSSALNSDCATAEMCHPLRRMVALRFPGLACTCCPWAKGESQKQCLGDRLSWPAASSCTVLGEASRVEKGLPWPHLPKALNLETTHLVSFGFPETML